MQKKNRLEHSIQYLLTKKKIGPSVRTKKKKHGITIKIVQQTRDNHPFIVIRFRCSLKKLRTIWHLWQRYKDSSIKESSNSALWWISLSSASYTRLHITHFTFAAKVPSEEESNCGIRQGRFVIFFFCKHQNRKALRRYQLILKTKQYADSTTTL